jgi:hypothetical protein
VTWRNRVSVTEWPSRVRAVPPAAVEGVAEQPSFECTEFGLGGQVGLELCGGADPVTAQDRPEQSSHVGHDDATVGAAGVGRLLVVGDVEPADLHQRISPTLRWRAGLVFFVRAGGRSQGILDGASGVLVERPGHLETVVEDPRRRHRPLWNVLDRLGAGPCVFAVVDGVGAVEPVGQLGDGGLGRQTGEELDMSTAVFGEPCHVVGGDLGREHVDLGAGEALIAPGIEDLGPPTQLLRPGGGPPRLARGGPAPTAQERPVGGMPLDLVTTSPNELDLRGGDFGLEPIDQPAGLDDHLGGRGDLTAVDRVCECRRPSEHAQDPTAHTFETQPENPEKIWIPGAIGQCDRRWSHDYGRSRKVAAARTLGRHVALVGGWF